MSSRRASWALIPAAFLVVGLLVGQELAPRQSAPTLATANGSPAAVVSESASASSATAERASVEAGNGGDGGTSILATPASTTVNGGEAQQDEQQSSNLPVVGSNPTPAIIETATVVATALVAEPEVRLSSQSPALWLAIEAAFPPSEQATAYRVAMCESSGNTEAVGRSGEKGAWQILEVFHGAVPEGIYAQAVHAAQVLAINGWGIWSCA
jgi:hypothetical protein